MRINFSVNFDKCAILLCHALIKYVFFFFLSSFYHIISHSQKTIDQNKFFDKKNHQYQINMIINLVKKYFQLDYIMFSLPFSLYISSKTNLMNEHLSHMTSILKLTCRQTNTYLHDKTSSSIKKTLHTSTYQESL